MFSFPFQSVEENLTEKIYFSSQSEIIHITQIPLSLRGTVKIEFSITIDNHWFWEVHLKFGPASRWQQV